MYKEQFMDALNSVNFSNWNNHEANINTLFDLFKTIKKQHNMIFFIGNGGSAGIAIHMSVDYLKNGHMRTHGMHDPAMLTCLGNDYGYEYVFSKQLEYIADKGDLLVAISSSGNSRNIINGVKTALEKGCQVLTLTGFSPDNRVRKMGTYNVYVPSMEYGIVESVHNMILQQVVDEVMDCSEKGEC